MKLSLICLACLCGMALGKPDEVKERQFEELKAIGIVKKKFLQSTKAIKPDEHSQKKFALSKHIKGTHGAKALGAGQSQTIGISAAEYTVNKEEIFTITAASTDDKLRIVFSSFKLERASGCGWCWDYVNIYDGPDKNAPLLGEYCSDDLPPSFVSSGNVLTVLFYSDISITDEGFQAEVSIITFDELVSMSANDPQFGCGGGIGIMTGQSGVMESSNYPGNYGDNEHCRWQIQANSGTITLEIEDLEIEWCPSQGCVWDKLAVYDGSNPSASNMLQTFCGWNIDWSNSFGGVRTWTTSGSSAYLSFSSDGSVGARGFRIRYTVNGDAIAASEYPAADAPAPAPAPSPTPAPVAADGLPARSPGVVLYDDFDAVRRWSLFGHNRVRSLHQNTPDLVWSADLAEGCKEWAITMANAGSMYHSSGNWGENLYWGYGYDTEGSVARAIFAWYEERHDYDYSTGAATSDGAVIGHFTQAVWNSSTEVGCAMSSVNDLEVYVVCRYSPPGNYIGQYTSHVFNPVPNADFPSSWIHLDDMSARKKILK